MHVRGFSGSCYDNDSGIRRLFTSVAWKERTRIFARFTVSQSTVMYTGAIVRVTNTSYSRKTPTA